MHSFGFKYRSKEILCENNFDTQCFFSRSFETYKLSFLIAFGAVLSNTLSD